jgi:hypothetical protein
MFTHHPNEGGEFWGHLRLGHFAGWRGDLAEELSWGDTKVGLPTRRLTWVVLELRDDVARLLRV